MATVIKAPEFEDARSILGNDLIIAEEIAASCRLFYSEDQRNELLEKLPDYETLRQLRANDMLLIAGPPIAISLNDIQSIHPNLFYSRKKSEEDYSSIEKVDALGWMAFHKTPLKGSLGLCWSAQQELISVPMIIPNAAEVAWMLLTCKAVRNIHLLEELYVRTASDNVIVGNLDSNGLDINDFHPDEEEDDDVGILGALKF